MRSPSKGALELQGILMIMTQCHNDRAENQKKDPSLFLDFAEPKIRLHSNAAKNYDSAQNLVLCS